MSRRSQPERFIDPPIPSFTEKQGQYLAFIKLYMQLHRIAPAETDFMRYFGTTAPSVHRMIVALEKKGLIARKPRQARSIRLLLPEDRVPALESIKTAASLA